MLRAAHTRNGGGDHHVLSKNKGASRPKQKRRSAPLLLKWVALLVVVATIRGIWSSVLISRSWSNTGNGFVVPAQPAQTTRPRGSRRHKPLRQATLRYSREISTDGLWFEPATPENVKLLPKKLIDICGGENGSRLDSTSRVIIFGFLNHPLGSELVVSLSKHCGVTSVIGITDQAVELYDTHVMAYLIRNYPTFRVHFLNFPANSTTLNEMFLSFQPTHVVHLEALTVGLPRKYRATIPMHMALRSSMTNLENLIDAVTLQHQEGRGDPVFLHVFEDEPGEDFLRRALTNLYPMITRTNGMKHARHLRLPSVFGPFPTGPRLLENKDSSLGPLIYLTEAVHSIILSLTVKQSSSSWSGLSIFAPSQDHTIQGDHYSDIFNTSILSDRAQARRAPTLLSFSHKIAFPHSDVSVHESPKKRVLQRAFDETNELLETNNDETVSILQRRQHNLFPCESGCGKQAQCIATTAMSSLITITRNITQDCHYAIYMVDFSTKIEELPAISSLFPGHEDKDWVPPKRICQIAMVSGKSKLVSKLVGTLRKEASESNLPSSHFNGNVTHKNWHLAWLEEEDSESLEEADFIMPKLLPSTFFSSQVAKAIYLEPSSFKQLPSLPVFYFMMQKSMDAKRIPKVQPSIHLLLITHTFSLSKVSFDRMGMDGVAKFILQQRSKSVDRPWPRKQLQLYDFERKAPGFDFQLPDTTLIAFNLRSDRGRRFLCDWYEEQLFWSKDQNNRDLEDLSMAMVVARWRASGHLDGEHERFGERVVDEAAGDTRVNPSLNQSQYFIKLVETPLKARRQFGEGGDDQ